MGRNRKPSAELERKGSFQHNPARGSSRAAEPEPSLALGPAPAEFLKAGSPRSAALLKIWEDFLAFELKDVRLTNMDHSHLEMLCKLKYLCREPNPPASVFTAFLTCLGKFGLTTVDRSKASGIHHKTNEQESAEWDEFAGASVQ